MALARWQRTIVDEAGNVLPGAQITVRREVGGAPLAVLYSDRDGAVPIGNPFTADGDGFAAFHALGGAHRIDVVSGAFSRTLRYVALGTKAEQDADPDLDAIAALSGLGFPTRLSDESWAQRTIAGTAGEITVTNGDGDAGNPTLSLPARVDLGGKVLEIPNDAAPVVDANGEIAIDTSVADFSHGVIKYFGGEEMAVISVPVAQLTSPSNGDVPTYNATNDEFELIPGSVGIVTAVAQGAIAAATLDIALGSADMYEIDLINVLPVTDNVSLLARFSQSGSYVTSANYAYDSFQGASENVNSGQTSMQVNVTGGNASGEGSTFTFRVFRPSQTGRKLLNWFGGVMITSGAPRGNNGSATLTLNTDAIDGVRFFFSSGDIASGRYAVRAFSST